MKCGEGCVNLAEMNWASCGECSAGYVDADGVPGNGCESSAGGAGYLPVGRFFEGEECFGCGAFNGEGFTAELAFIEHACAVFFLNNDTRFRRDLQPVR